MRAKLAEVARLIFAASVVLAGGLNATATAQAPTEIYPAPKPGPAPAAGMPNFNGVWDVEYIPNIEERIGGPVPFTDHGQAAWDNRVLGEDPTGYCQPAGLGRIFHSPFPLQIVQTHGQVTFLFEYFHTWHRVFTDGQAHPEPLSSSWWGHSIGHYEGDRLVVDTVGMNDRTWLFTSGVQHSDQLHLTQVFELKDPDTIEYTVTYDDPVFFTEAWSVTSTFTRSEFDLLEYICTENNRDVNHFITNND